MPPKASPAGVVKARAVLSSSKPSYIAFSKSRQQDADISPLPVPARGKLLGAEWKQAKRELGMPVAAKKKTPSASKTSKPKPKTATKKTVTKTTVTKKK